MTELDTGRRVGFRARGWWLLIAAWLISYGARPFVLGFYHDDWSSLLTPEALNRPFGMQSLFWFMRLYVNRPVLGLGTFLLSGVCGDSPFLWHSAIALLALSSAWAIRTFLRTTLRLVGVERLEAADLAAALWLLFPWTLGTTAWPLVGTTLIAAICFAMGGHFALSPGLSNRRRIAACSACLLASFLSYEAFYGQFIIFFLIAAIARRRLLSKSALGPLAAGIGAQALALGWNRITPVLGYGMHKSLSAEWMALAIRNLRSLRSVLNPGWPQDRFLRYAVAIAAFVLIVHVFRRGMKEKASAAASRGAALLVLAGGCGLALSVVVVSLASYSLTGIGLFSRTTIGPSLWVAAILSGVFGVFLQQKRAMRTAGIALFAFLAISMAMHQSKRLGDWAEVWRMERGILLSAPVAELHDAKPGAVVLFVGPHVHNGVEVFASTWDLDSAMKHHYPDLRDLHFYPARADWTTTWDGAVLEQRNPGLVNRIEVSEVWLWDCPTQSVKRAESPLAN